MTTTVQDLMFIRKLMDSEASHDWPQVDEQTANFLMGNLRCWRDLWCNGEWYIAKGYGRVVWHETKGDKWFVNPMFRRHHGQQTRELIEVKL